jgi:hypothetical protein
MITISSRFPLGIARTATVLAALLLAACAPQYSAPQQVQANNPSVTYKFNGDQELLQANQSATTFCHQYRSAAQTSSIAASPEGGKTVIFECVPMPVVMTTAAAPAQPFNPNPTYTYNTDQDLLDASRNAETYCMNNGSQRALSTIVTNANGTKSVTFQCTR